MKILMILSNPFIVDPRVYKEAMSLSDAGHEVTVIFWDREAKYSSDETVKNVRVIGIQTKGLMKLLPHDLFRNPLWWWKAYKKAQELYRNGYTFEVVHCHDLDTLQTGVWLKKHLKIKLVYDAHEIFGYMIERTLPKFVSKISFMIEKILIKNVDQIITVNDPLKTFFSKITNIPISIVMNCGELTTRTYLPPHNTIFTITYFGILDSSRMFPKILDYVGTIDKTQFIIAGKKARLYNEVEQVSKKYRNTVFLGSIPYDTVIEKTLQCNVILCMLDPSDRNNQVGLPNKIFDAMLTGRPVIVTKGLFYSELVETEKCGVSVGYDFEEVKNTILMLRDNPKRCEELGKNGLNAAIRVYNWGKQKETLLAVYERLNA
ncbi:MAG TPA: glycosyltransferase family 4 protein [Thermoplasmata archaeon]|nr:glycosyltransferase family 4 protein [Thermoplasmata archaeon]